MKKWMLYLACVLVTSTWAQEAQVIDSIKRTIGAQHTDKKLAYWNDVLARNYLELNPDSVNKYARRSLSYSEKANLYEYQVDAWNTLGMNSRKTGDFDQSLGYHFKALKLARDHKLASYYFYTTYTAICLAYTEQGNYTPAIEYSYKSLHEIEIEKDTLNLALGNNNLANIFFDAKKYDKALMHYKKAFALARQLNHLYGQGLTTANIGSVYYEMGKLDSAKLYFDRSLAIAIQIEDDAGEALNYGNLGSYYQKKKDYHKAIDYFNKALGIYKAQEMEPDVSTMYYNLGDAYYELGDYQHAKEFGEKSLEIAKRINALSQQESAELVLKNVYEKLHNTAEAYSHYKAYIAIHDSIFSQDNKKAQFKAELEYEYVKKRYTDSLDQVLVARIQKQALSQEKVKTETQRKLTYVALFGCLLLLLLAGFIFKGYRDKQKANRIITDQKYEVEHQKAVIEEKQKEILDSIHYARRIQTAMVTPDDFLASYLKEHFILYMPKDIVSGDFYWSTERDGLFYLAICDSTGHGVPGAFMSLLNIGYLSEAINEKHLSEPHHILNYVRQRLINSISKEEQKDGFDGILLCIDRKQGVITYAAANNSPVWISNGALVELPYDKMPVGKGERQEPFSLHSIAPQAGDMLYLYSDGYADQFGGPKGKKFMYRQLKELLLSISSMPVDQQKQKLGETLTDWKGRLEQVDDVLVAGIRF